jgi:predicted aconitase
MPKVERLRQAEAFVANAQWRVLGMRGTRVQVTTGEARVTMRVAAKGVPMHAIREVMETLARQTPVKVFVADGVAQPGEWHHKASWWARDPAGTFTVFRELSDGPVTEINVIEDGCGSRTTIRYVWDAGVVEDFSQIANSGDQGFSVRIGGVSRDQETGLFNYYVTTTERKTQTLEEHVVAQDVFSTIQDADFFGMRGDMEDPVDDAGDAVAVPEPGNPTPGTLITVQWDLNLEDCTLNARSKKAVAEQNVLAAQANEVDLFSERTETTIVASPTNDTDAPEPNAGLSVAISSKARPDGLYDKQRTENQERTVDDAQVSRQRDLFSEGEDVTDRGQASALGAVPVPAGGVVYTHTSEKTPGALYTNKVGKNTELPVSDAQVDSQQDLFGSSTGVSDRNQSAPLGAAPAAAGGVIKAHSSDKTPGGLYNNKENTQVENPVEDAQVTNQRTIFANEESTADRNQVSALGAAPAASGGIVYTHNSSKTPGGLYNNQVGKNTELPVSDAQVDSSQDIFGTEATVSDRNQASALGDAPAAAGGVIKTHSSEKTPGGLYNNRERTQTEQSVVDAQVTDQSTIFAHEESDTDRNQVAALGAAPAASGGIVYTHSSSKTPGGLYNNQVGKNTELPVSDASATDHLDLFSHDESATDRNQESALDAAPEPDAGVVYTHTSDKTPGGLYNNQVAKKTEREVADAQVSVSGDASHVQTTTHDKSVADPGALTDPNTTPGTLKSRVRSKTPGGLFDVEDTEKVFTQDREVVAEASYGAKNYFEERTTQVVQNAAAVTSVPAFVDEGALVEVQSVKNPADLYDVTKDTKTPTARALYGSNTDDRGTFQYCVFRNQAKTWTPTWYDEDCTSKEFLPSVNAYGLIDGTATQFISAHRGEDSLDMYLTGWQEYLMKKEVSHIDPSATPMTIKTRLVPYTVYEKDTTGNYSDAHQDLADKLDELNTAEAPAVALGAASYNISKVVLRTGATLYKITIVGNLDTANAGAEVTPSA